MGENRITLFRILKKSTEIIKFQVTLTSMSPILFTAFIIGLPTTEGKICSGKFDPAYPHFTNCNTFNNVKNMCWMLVRPADTI